MDQARSLPTGTVTVLLADVVSSSPLWETGTERAAEVFARLNALVALAVERHDGALPVEQGEGDSFVAGFARSSSALACAVDVQRSIRAEPWPNEVDVSVRMAVHSGEVVVLPDGRYAGPVMNRCARVRSLAHGGQILVSQATKEVAGDEIPTGFTLVDMGLHSLRGLAGPERVFQLCHPDLPAAFPPLVASGVTPNNLPATLTSLLGRAHDVADVSERMRSSRTVTLVGSGGVGKTRLANEVATGMLEAFPDGVWWVDLAAIGDPALITAAVAAAAGCRERAGEQLGVTLARQLRNQRVLLVLDNCEHLVDACAEVVALLVRSCPSLEVLATSREPLGVDGEISWPVAPLQLPPDAVSGAADLVGCVSVDLFVERAEHVRPGFGPTDENAIPIAEICRHLDGIPLAIELAAARVRLLSPAQIAAALTDRFRLLTGVHRGTIPRQQTLEASVDWSYSLLSEDERTVLARAAVFVGGLDLDAAEAVCAGDAIDRYAAFDHLSSLVEKSLIEVDSDRSPARYRLLETVRAFALTKLDELGEAAEVRDRHLAYYLAVAERVEAHLRGAKRGGSVRVVDRDLANVRAAMDWAVTSGQAEPHLRLTVALRGYWLLRSMFSEIASSIEAALSLSAVEPALHARALALAAVATLMGGQYRAAAVMAEEAVALARETGDDQALSLSLAQLGWARFWLGDQGVAEADEALSLADQSDLPHLMSALLYRGVIETNLQSPDAGRPYFDRCLTLADHKNARYWPGTTGHFLGQGFVQQGRIHEAEDVLGRAAEACRAIGHDTFLVFNLAELARCALFSGRLPLATQLADEAARVARELGPSAIAVASERRSLVPFASGDLAAARTSIEEALSLWLEQGSAWHIAWMRVMRAAVTLVAGDAEVAQAMADDAVEVSRASGMRWQLGQALLWRARVALARGHAEEGETLAHEALQVMQRFGDRLGLAMTLETLAAAAVSGESFAEAIRLCAAANHIRDDNGLVRLPIDEPGFQSTVATARAALAQRRPIPRGRKGLPCGSTRRSRTPGAAAASVSGRHRGGRASRRSSSMSCEPLPLGSRIPRSPASSSSVGTRSRPTSHTSSPSWE